MPCFWFRQSWTTDLFVFVGPSLESGSPAQAAVEEKAREQADRETPAVTDSVREPMEPPSLKSLQSTYLAMGQY